MGALDTGPSIADRPITVTIIRRTDSPTARAASEALQRIASLADAGVIADYEDVTIPPRQVGESCEASVASLIDELESIGDQLGVTLEPAMQRTIRHNRLTGETEEVSVFPVVTVLVRDASDGSVLAAAPTTTGEDLVRVDDLLAKLTPDSF